MTMEEYDNYSQALQKERLRNLAKMIYLVTPQTWSEPTDLVPHFRLVQKFHNDLLSSILMDEKVAKLIESEFKTFGFMTNYPQQIRKYFSITRLVIAKPETKEEKNA